MPVRGQPQGIPAPAGVKDPQLVQILNAIRENVIALKAAVDGGLVGGNILGLIAKGGWPDGLEVPGSAVKPGPRPAKPQNLQANGIFGAIILTVDQMPRDAAYIEWLVSPDADFANSKSAGQSSVPIFKDYVGDGEERWYWCRAIGYGSPPQVSALNDTVGTQGRSAPDPEYVRDTLTTSKWQASQSYIVYQVVQPTVTQVVRNGVVLSFQVVTGGTSAATEPTWGSVTGIGDTIIDGTVKWKAIDAGEAPFVVGQVGGNPTVLMQGAIIEEASITSAKIKSLAANKITASSLSAITANLGTVTSGTFKTADAPNRRMEMSSAGSFPLWYGSGTKSAANALFSVNNNGKTVIRSALSGGRLALDDDQLKVYDGNNRLRVVIGRL